MIQAAKKYVTYRPVVSTEVTLVIARKEVAEKVVAMLNSAAATYYKDTASIATIKEENESFLEEERLKTVLLTSQSRVPSNKSYNLSSSKLSSNVTSNHQLVNDETSITSSITIKSLLTK